MTVYSEIIKIMWDERPALIEAAQSLRIDIETLDDLKELFGIEKSLHKHAKDY